ncbi:MAG: hypothetical protein NT010_10590 [Proteobacteria bacterium]|nr:hypothetical protein [Pseudomonadota bacterium]
MFVVSKVQNKKIVVSEEELSMLQEKLYCLSSQICILSEFIPDDMESLKLSRMATEGLKYSLKEFSKQAEEMGDRLSSFL